MRTLILLLMMCASLFAAERGVSYNSATLVVTQTNLTQRFTASTVAQTLALGLNGTNGTFTINSTNGGYAGTITMDEGGSMLIVNSGPFDDFDASAFTFISTNIQLADLAQFWNPDVDPLNPAISLQASGTILAKGMYVEAAWESDDFTRIQPTDFKISGGTNTNYFFVEIGGTGEINRLHEGTNTFRVALDSGYGAGGIRVLTDQGGLYLNITNIGGGGGNVFNTGTPVASNVPRYTDTTGTNVAPSTVLIDAAGQLSSTNAWIYANGAAVATQTSTNAFTLSDLTAAGNTLPGQIGAACSDETTALTTGTNKVRFRMPYAMTLTAVRASLTTAQTAGSIITIDINEDGTSVLSTKITIDDNETTSTTAATPPVISDSALADDAIVTVDLDQVGTSPTGLKIWLIGTY